MGILQRNQDNAGGGVRWLLFGVGAALLLSGVVHSVVWLLEGGSWEGSVSWRKPILFGFSGGMTVVSVAWMTGKLRHRLADSILLAIFGFAMAVEVGLITLQQWRGVASHFNTATSFDAFVLAGIETLVVPVTLVIGYFTFRSFAPLQSPPSMTLAIRSGMVLLLLSCLLGFFLVAWGNRQIALGLAPETFGAAGVMKFPHGVPMHAIQFLPFVDWALRRLGLRQSVRSRTVAFLLTSVVTFCIFSLVQTFTGRARFDVGLLGGGLLALSAIMAVVPLPIIGRDLVRDRTRAGDAIPKARQPA